jgi:hypothetical protein
MKVFAVIALAPFAQGQPVPPMSAPGPMPVTANPSVAAFPVPVAPQPNAMAAVPPVNSIANVVASGAPLVPPNQIAYPALQGILVGS